MKSRPKKLWFSITQQDCEFHFYRGSGDGGQKKQKTSSACRCVHEPSGATGKSEDSRKQSENKKLAFKRMAESEEFQSWLKLEIERRQGKVKLEVQDGSGNWVEGDWNKKDN